MNMKMLMSALSLAAVTVVIGASSSSADVDGQPNVAAAGAYSVKYHFTGGRVIRVGTSAWGYTHVKKKHGWNDSVRVCIQDTFDSGRKVTSGTTDTYKLSGSGHWFKVVYQRASKNKGVITAYGDLPNKDVWICGW